MATDFKPYDLNQPMLIPADLRDWLPKGHIALFISQIVDSMNIFEILDSYKMKAGKPGYNPRLLLKLLVYGYSKGIRSSRKIERATYEDVGFRFIAADSHPDHDTIATFRARHINSLDQIFTDVLELCKKSSLLKCNHICLDGTKIKANANKSKSRKHTQLLKSRDELAAVVEAILQEAEEVDRAEDEKYGKGVRGDELPKELHDAKKRQKKIDELLEKMKAEAKEKKEQYGKKKREKEEEEDDWLAKTGEKLERRPPVNPMNKSVKEVIPGRRNPTDYDSRIMKEGVSGGFIQAYNCQAAVDADSQVIVATDVVNQPNDKQLASPMLKKTMEEMKKADTKLKAPIFFSADNGYYSEREVVALEGMGVDPYMPPTKDSIGKRHIKTSKGNQTITEFMKDKLNSKTGKEIYKFRKITPEPVFGQIKEIRGFRKFLLRGLSKVKGEWKLMAIAHNLGKLHLSGAM